MVALSDSSFNAARNDMMENQITPRGISDAAVLDAFLPVPRERFVSSTHLDEDEV